MVVDARTSLSSEQAARDYIDQQLIGDLAKAVDAGAVAVGFRGIGQGMVILGSFVDGHPVHAENQADHRFKEVLRCFFPTHYSVHNNPNSVCAFHEDLKYVMAAGLRKNARTVFLDRAQARIAGTSHLMTMDVDGREKLVLVLEDFFEDFKTACAHVKAYALSGARAPGFPPPREV